MRAIQKAAIGSLIVGLGVLALSQNKKTVKKVRKASKKIRKGFAKATKKVLHNRLGKKSFRLSV